MSIFFFCRSSGRNFRVNSFLLSMASTVMHKMICSGFREGMARKFSMEDVDGTAFEEVLNMWCGKEGRVEKELGDVIVMANVADRLEMLEIFTVLEAAILGELCAGMCAEVLMSSRRLGLGKVEEAAWAMAVERFDEVSRTAGFMRLDEETVGKLLEEDGLGVRKEEEVFEALAGWIQGDEGRGLVLRGLFRKIRFGAMEREYLEEKASGMLPEEHREWMEGLVGEALRAKAAVRAKATVELGQLGAKALTRRRGRGVDWGRYSGAGGGGRRLKGHPGSVFALAECEGRMCSGSEDGSIRIWSLATLEEERVLDNEGDSVKALAAWEDQVISGHRSGKVRVWDVASGQRRRELLGHTLRVESLCVVGSLLASGSADGSIRVWTTGPGPEWPCARTLAGHGSWVQALAGWEGRLIGGCWDSTILVWHLETGELEATLNGHTRAVSALLARGERLFSASYDGTIRAWALGTWAAAAAAAAYDVRDAGQYPRCLAASGPRLVTGSEAARQSSEHTPYEVRVWDPRTLACERRLRQPAGAEVFCLAAAGGEVWGGVGSEVVVWGRD